MHADRRAVDQQVPAPRLRRPAIRRAADAASPPAAARCRLRAWTRDARTRSTRARPPPPAPRRRRRAPTRAAGQRHPIARAASRKPLDVGVAADPSPVDRANGVDGADPARAAVRPRRRVEQRHLERNRDARAADAEARGRTSGSRRRRRPAAAGRPRPRRRRETPRCASPARPSAAPAGRRRRRPRWLRDRAEPILLDAARARVSWPTSPARRRRSSAIRSGRRARASPGRRRPSRSRPALAGAPPARRNSSSGRQSLRRSASDGDLDDFGARARASRARAPRDRPARRRSRATTGRCARPPVCAIRSSKRGAPFDVDVLGAERERVARMRRRSSSVRRTRRLPRSAGRSRSPAASRPASAPATSGSATASRRSSTRSASTTASRCWRSSAVVAAVTVTQSERLSAHKKKASSTGGLKRLGSCASRGGRSGQGGCLFRSAPIPPPGRRTHWRREAEAGRRRQLKSTGRPSEASDDSKASRDGCQHEAAISP